MRVLVAAASRHGATMEIAEAIGRALDDRGHAVDVRPVDRAGDPSAYDAVVLGSAVYVGHWLEPARRFAEEHAAQLAARPTWLFSSGPIGDPPKPEAERAVEIAPLREATGAREHRLFAGRIDKGALSFGERAVTVALRVPDGDFRDWDEIRDWATAIGDALADWGASDAR